MLTFQARLFHKKTAVAVAHFLYLVLVVYAWADDLFILCFVPRDHPAGAVLGTMLLLVSEKTNAYGLDNVIVGIELKAAKLGISLVPLYHLLDIIFHKST